MENKVADLLKIIAVITLAAGILASIIVGIALESFVAFLIVLLSSFFSYCLWLGFAEIIQLLDDIKNGRKDSDKKDDKNELSDPIKKAPTKQLLSKEELADYMNKKLRTCPKCKYDTRAEICGTCGTAITEDNKKKL